MKLRKIFLLLILTGPFGVQAQFHDFKNNSQAAIELIKRYQDIVDSTFVVPDETIPVEKALKARNKVLKNLVKTVDKTTIDSEPEKQLDLLMHTTNASLWYKNVQSSDFKILLRKLVTGTQISRNHIHGLRDAYHKWIIVPSLKNFNTYSKKLSETGKSYEILCKLTVGGAPRNTIIKYRNIATADIKSLEAYVHEKVVPVGNYFLWFEDHGQVINEGIVAQYCITSTQKIEYISSF